MVTSRLINPDREQVRNAIARALHLTADDRSGIPTSQGEFILARCCRESPEGLVYQIDEDDEGTVIISGHVVVKEGYRESGGAVALLSSWWTDRDDVKFVLLAGCFVEFQRGQSHEELVALSRRLKPREVIRGYRINRREGLVGTLSHTPFATLSRMPAIDPTREALELAALYGDPAARDALHDFKAERGLV